jgi:hypothetical protein
VYRELEDIEELGENLAPIVNAMKEKFLKYWEEVPAVTIIANCLHPTFKKKYTKRLLHKYRSNLNLPTYDVDTDVDTLFDEMFNIYNTRRMESQPPPTSSTQRYEHEITKNIVYVIFLVLRYSIILIKFLFIILLQTEPTVFRACLMSCGMTNL